MATKPALLGETLEIKKANQERLTLNSGGISSITLHPESRAIN
jgi:hypothetical protein